MWRKLRRRKLVQWALAYLAAAWAVLEVLDLVGQQFGWPPTLLRGITLAFGLGFLLTLVLAWYHGERGAQQVSGTELLILALLLVVGGGLLWRYARAPEVAPAATQDSIGSVGTDHAAVPVPEKSIAVLPLANESGDADQQYFSDGLSEDLITALSQFAGLKVISRNSAFQFRGSTDDSRVIGAKLGVAHLLEGSVRRLGEQVRITAQLVDARDGSTVWSERYDRPYRDLFKLQDDITQAVAGALQARLMSGGDAVAQSDRPPGGDLGAYTAYLQGKFSVARGTEADVRQAIAQFTAAVRLDPGYAQAHAELSQAWVGLARRFLGGSEARQAYTQARAAANQALALDQDLAAAHVARGYVLLSADQDWTGALAEYQRAVQLAPNDGLAAFNMGNLLWTLGQPQRAVALTHKALGTDPLHASWYNWLSIYLSSLGRLDEAEAAERKAIELQPAAVSYHEQLAVIEILRGDAAAALRAARQEPAGPWQDAALALALQVGSDRAAADAALRSLIEKQADAAAYQVAQAYALRKQPDEMFDWLDRAWEQRDAGMQYLLADPILLRYHDDPRFAAFGRQVGLPLPGRVKDRG